MTFDYFNLKDPKHTFVIAEAGSNWKCGTFEQDLEQAKKLIKIAAKAKADAVKFQTYTAEKLTTKTAKKYWDDGISGETQYDVFKKLDRLANSDWKEIFEYAKNKITCFSTPFDYESVDLLY